jgi:pyridoxamine 5'-phosphate oxidase
MPPSAVAWEQYFMGSNESDGAHGNDPVAWFRSSFERACQGETFDASRAALATSDRAAHPSVRFVLVKRFDERGFVFYTSFDSRKARELAENPQAALAFHWSSIGEQVRIEGVVSRVSEAESDAYFATRPRGSQLGAWASAQSQPIAERAALVAQLAEVSRRFAAGVVPRPTNWGGFLLVPSAIEFWRDQRDRLHDRFCFTRAGSTWQRSRLQP